MDELELGQLLSAAYIKAHAHADRPGAVALLRAKIAATPTARAAATRRHAELKRIVEARSQGQRCGCYVTKFAHDLMTEALADG